MGDYTPCLTWRIIAWLFLVKVSCIVMKQFIKSLYLTLDKKKDCGMEYENERITIFFSLAAQYPLSS